MWAKVAENSLRLFFYQKATTAIRTNDPKAPISACGDDTNR
jgi:hypothetical protein